MTSTSVSDVTVIETAASQKARAIRSRTGNWKSVCRHAASMTNMSSIPIPATQCERIDVLLDSSSEIIVRPGGRCTNGRIVPT